MGGSGLKRWALSAALLGVAGMVSSPAPTSAASYPHGGTITYIDAPLTPFVHNFNPFSTSNALSSAEINIYEPLLYFNSYTEQIIPKLATSYSYSDHNLVITFQLRKGVYWSDGQPFTSKDVVFTYEDILKHPAIDLTGVGSDLKSVQALGPYTVRFTLKQVNIPFLFYLAGDVPIIPEHVWANKNPVTWTDPNPVTTGPWLVQSINPNQIILKANPHYWNAPEPYVSRIVVPMYLSNTTADLAMAQGRWDMGQQFIPDLQAALLSKSPNYHYWFPGMAPTTLFTNDKVYPLSLVAFRQALSAAIDRPQVSAVGEYGYEPPDNLTGLPLPTYAKWVPASILKAYPNTYSPSKARALLKAAGFKWNSAGQLLTPKGQPVSLTLMAPSGATDYVSDCEIIAKNLKAIGITINLKVPAVNTEIADLADGNFQLAELWTSSGPGPYFVYDSLLNSVYSAPEGKNAVSNYERWTDPTTDHLLAEFAATRDPAKQKAIMAQLEGIVARNLPFIPLTNEVAWEEYNTTHIVGWPSAQNPYGAFASAWDYEYIFAQVHEK